MRQVNAVNGSQMVVKLRDSYYSRVRGKGVEIDWNQINYFVLLRIISLMTTHITTTATNRIRLDDAP